MPFLDDEGDLAKIAAWITVENFVCLRTSASVRYNGRLLCARVEVLSHASEHCGVIAYTALQDDGEEMAGLCADWQFQWGMGPTILDDSFPSEDPDDPDPEPIPQETLDLLHSMLLAALPLKEHFLSLKKEEAQQELPMNKSEKEQYLDIPQGNCIFVSPWSNTVTLGGFADELVPVDLRHTGAGSTPLSLLMVCCLSFSMTLSSLVSHLSQPIDLDICMKMATITHQGGMHAATDPNEVRQFQQVGWGADGQSTHILQNAHDLAIHIEGRGEPEEDAPQLEGFSCTIPLENDDRPNVMTALRKMLFDLLEICNCDRTPERNEEMGAYQSVEPTISTVTTDTQEDHISDYDPTIQWASQIVEYDGTNLTQSVLSAFSTVFDEGDDEFVAVEERFPFVGLSFIGAGYGAEAHSS
eukprot:2119479-Amphidinium_carterae.1